MEAVPGVVVTGVVVLLVAVVVVVGVVVATKSKREHYISQRIPITAYLHLVVSMEVGTLMADVQCIH